MTRSTQTTKVLNGEELVQRIRDSTNAFKAGRFMPITTRPWVTNIYLMSRINYRSCALNLRQQDVQKIQPATKAWVTQGFLIKPNETILYRNPEEGGLGLVHTATRCKANLIKTFISQGDPSSKHANSYLSCPPYSEPMSAKSYLLTQSKYPHTSAGTSSQRSERCGRRKTESFLASQPGAGRKSSSSGVSHM